MANILHREVVLHGKYLTSRSCFTWQILQPEVVVTEMLLLQISQPLVEFDQVVVKGGEGSRQGHHIPGGGGVDSRELESEAAHVHQVLVRSHRLFVVKSSQQLLHLHHRYLIVELAQNSC